MRSLVGAFAAIFLLLSGSPTQAACPPLNPAQIAQETAAVAGQAVNPTKKPINAISVSQFRPFCLKNSASLLCSGGSGVKPTVDLVKSVDSTLRAEFEYRTDETNAGVSDFWNDNTVCGDCEDYALTLATRLHAAGVGGDYMWLMFWEPYTGAAHATLIVQVDTDEFWEIGTGVGVPAPFDPNIGRRFAVIRFDGQRQVQPYAGFKVSVFGDAVVAVQ